MAEWRTYGPIGVLFDMISSISSPQTHQRFVGFQEDEAKRLNIHFQPLELIKPVKTRWNSYYKAFERAIVLQQSIDAYAYFKIAEHRARSSSEPPRKFIAEGGLTGSDWATIREYAALLKPFEEASVVLQGRGSSGTHGAI